MTEHMHDPTSELPGWLCPTCRGVVAARDDGALFDHQRYADGSVPYPSQPYNLIQCEGESEL